MRAVTDGPGAEAAGWVMGADKTNLIFDHLLVKEPDLGETVWRDLTYWPVAGEQIATSGPDPVTAETGAVEYLQLTPLGSEIPGDQFQPRGTSRTCRKCRHRGRARPARHHLLRRAGRLHHSPRRHPAAPGNTSSDVRRRAYVQRWAGDDVPIIPGPI